MSSNPNISFQFFCFIFTIFQFYFCKINLYTISTKLGAKYGTTNYGSKPHANPDTILSVNSGSKYGAKLVSKESTFLALN